MDRYYFADKLGVAIFQDMPQKYLAQGRTNETVKFFVDDLKAMVAGRGSHPSILQYTAFNEGDCWEVFTDDNPPSVAGIVQLFKRLDPHRLVDTGSGDPSGNNPMGGATTPDQSWAFNNSGDVTDVHTYPVPGDPRPIDPRDQFGTGGSRYGMVGEYSGLGATPADKEYLPGGCKHQNWPNTTNQTSELAQAYVALAQVLKLRAESGDVSASVMTQVTDIELECDGFLNYDRSSKFTAAERGAIHDAHQAIVRAAAGAP